MRYLQEGNGKREAGELGRWLAQVLRAREDMCGELLGPQVAKAVLSGVAQHHDRGGWTWGVCMCVCVSPSRKLTSPGLSPVEVEVCTERSEKLWF